MSLTPPTRAMRENPDLDQLKRQAKELLDDYLASSPEAVAEVAAYHRTATRETFALHDAQFVLARAYGFESWPKLRAAVDGVTAAKLHEAAESGAVATARQLLVRRPEIVDLGRGEMRALHMAVMRRDLEMTKLLLEFGADPDGGIWPKREATSPYVMARDRGYEEIVDVIDAARRQRGARGPKGPTDATRKLNRALQSGSDEAIVAVLDEHPDLAEMCTPDGLTLLHKMAGLGALQTMKWLLDRGADVNRKSQQGWTPLDFAATGQARRLALRQWAVRTRRGTAPRAWRPAQPSVSRNPGPLGLSRGMFQAGAGGNRRAGSGREGQPLRMSSAACSTSASILMNGRRSATSPSRPGRLAARCSRP